MNFRLFMTFQGCVQNHVFFLFSFCWIYKWGVLCHAAMPLHCCVVDVAISIWLHAANLGHSWLWKREQDQALSFYSSYQTRLYRTDSFRTARWKQGFLCVIRMVHYKALGRKLGLHIAVFPGSLFFILFFQCLFKNNWTILPSFFPPHTQHLTLPCSCLPHQVSAALTVLISRLCCVEECCWWGITV